MNAKFNADMIVLELIGDDERGYDFITAEEVLSLKELLSEQNVFTLYMDISPAKLQREPLMTRYKNLLSPVQQQIEDRNEALLFNAVADDIGKLLATSYSSPKGRGLVIFAAPQKFSSKGDHKVKYDKFLVYHLPEPPSDFLAWGKSPVLTELLIQLDEHEPTGIVLADRRRARFFLFYMGETAEYSVMEFDETPAKTKAVGWGAHNHEQWQEEHYRQHFRNVAALTDIIARKAGWKWLILAGPDEIPGEVEAHLPKDLRSKLIGKTNMGMNVTYNDVRDKVAPMVMQAEKEEEKETLEAFVGELAKENGRAVAGLADTTLAAQQARIATLLFPPNFTHQGWQCQSCGGLMADLLENPPATCIYCDGPLETIPDVVSVAAAQTLKQGGHVEVVRDSENQAILKTHGNIGALLRF